MPLEPLYSLEVAAELIPISLGNLNNLLIKYATKFPARYHTVPDDPGGRGNKSVRMLYESELLALREIVIKNSRRYERVSSDVR